MKTSYKVSLISVGATILASLLLYMGFGGGAEIFFIILGILACIAACVLFVVALILHFTESTTYSQAFFITSGILLLLGIGVCGPMLAGVHV
jgi:hypothetical protein